LITSDLAAAIQAIAGARKDIRFLLLGRGAQGFKDAHRLDDRAEAREDLPSAEIAALLEASTVALQPFPDGISARRTSAMAPLALGVPVVTTDGFLTDSVWRAGAVALAPVGRPLELARLCGALIDDRARRLELGERGAQLYQDRFSLERTVEAVLSVTNARLAQVQ
jgi:glycosyltransferase involved in cell wall biosynthesis